MWNKKQVKKYAVENGYDVPTWRGVVRWLFTDLKGRKPTKLQWAVNIAAVVGILYLMFS